MTHTRHFLVISFKQKNPQVMNMISVGTIKLQTILMFTFHSNVESSCLFGINIRGFRGLLLPSNLHPHERIIEC